MILSYPSHFDENMISIFSIETMLGPLNHLDFAIRPNAVRFNYTKICLLRLLLLGFWGIHSLYVVHAFNVSKTALF